MCFIDLQIVLASRFEFTKSNCSYILYGFISKRVDTKTSKRVEKGFQATTNTSLSIHVLFKPRKQSTCT